MDFDKDLTARQEARDLCRQAQKAQKILAHFPQEKLDGIVRAVAQAFSDAAGELAELAVRETGFGNRADKVTKNRFAAQTVAAAMEQIRCVGVIGEDPQKKLWEVGVPVGVICGIVPSTNPTSTVCYKALIAIKSGNAVIFSPHPKAAGCTLRAAQVVAEAAEKAGAPAGIIGCLSHASMAGCEELMHAPEVRLILATGGPGMVKAAYSSGKPAIGVGAGNGPAYIHPSADAAQALRCIVQSKTFDNGTVCASEQSILVERSMEARVKAEAKAMGFYFMTEAEAGTLAKCLFRSDGAMDPRTVGKTAPELAKLAGFRVPQDTKILVAQEEQAGPDHPYSREKLCPVLALYVLEDEAAVLEKAVELLEHEGAGHTFSMHAQDRTAVEKFAANVPVSRFLVNTPAALGGIGATTGLFPALTLGCGAVGGSASSNNIGPLDLVNIRRVAWGTEPPQHKAQPDMQPDAELVELLTRKILERLG